MPAVDHMSIIIEIQVLAGSGRRADAARALLDACRARWLSALDAQRLVPDIWLRLDPPVGPRGPLSADEWLEVFDFSGFFVQGPPTLVASEPMDLYRAAPSDRSRGMSWCTHRQMAERFLPKHDLWGRYEIWKALVKPEAILAVLFRPDDGLFVAPIGAPREVVVNPHVLGEVVRAVED